MTFPSFDDFMRNPDQDDKDRLIVTLIAALSVCPKYGTMTPGEIYDLMVKSTIELYSDIAKHDAGIRSS